VIDADGRPVRGALVGVEWGTVAVPEIALVADDDGRFVIDLPPGRFRIGVHAPDGRRGVLEVDVVGKEGGGELIAALSSPP
jgi:hypothetical protein